MIQVNKPTIEVLKETGAIFASALKTDEIDLSSKQVAQVAIVTDAPESSGTAITASTTLTVCATDGTTDTAIPFTLQTGTTIEKVTATGKSITIGDNAFFIITVDADDLGKLGLKEIVIKTTEVASCTINGTILSILSHERYSE